MKTVKVTNNGVTKYVRTSDINAAAMVSTIPNAEYCPKSEWKKNVRDANIVPEAENLMKESGGSFIIS